MITSPLILADECYRCHKPLLIGSVAYRDVEIFCSRFCAQRYWDDYYDRREWRRFNESLPWEDR